MHPSELLKLDGFRAGTVATLTDRDANSVSFTATSPITLIVGRRKITNMYHSVTIRDDTFFAITSSGEQVTIELRKIVRAEMTTTDMWKRPLLYAVNGFGRVAGYAVVGGIVLVIVFLALVPL